MTDSVTGPDAVRAALFRSVIVPSTLAEVAQAVSVATEDMRQQIYVERLAGGWRWRLTHPGGAYPLLRITARFLRVDYHQIAVGFRTVADGVSIVDADPHAPSKPEAWAMIQFDGPTSPADVEARIVAALATAGQPADSRPAP